MGFACLTVLAFLLPATFLSATPAMAADLVIPPELVGELVNYAVLGVTLLGGWVLRQAASWLAIDRDAKLVQRLEDGMELALGYARQRALEQALKLDSVDVRSRLVAEAASYLLPKLPSTLKALKIDANGLAERLTARLDKVIPLDIGR